MTSARVEISGMAERHGWARVPGGVGVRHDVYLRDTETLRVDFTRDGAVTEWEHRGGGEHCATPTLRGRGARGSTNKRADVLYALSGPRGRERTADELAYDLDEMRAEQCRYREGSRNRREMDDKIHTVILMYRAAVRREGASR